MQARMTAAGVSKFMLCTLSTLGEQQKLFAFVYQFYSIIQPFKAQTTLLQGQTSLHSAELVLVRSKADQLELFLKAVNRPLPTFHVPFLIFSLDVSLRLLYGFVWILEALFCLHARTSYGFSLCVHNPGIHAWRTLHQIASSIVSYLGRLFTSLAGVSHQRSETSNLVGPASSSLS